MPWTLWMAAGCETPIHWKPDEDAPQLADTSEDADADTDTDSDTDTDTDADTDSDTDADPGIDYCHVQYPCEQTVSAGAASAPVYGWAYAAGVTPGAGAGPGVVMEVGVGADGSEPAAGGWSWSPMAYNADKDGLTPGDLSNDEHQGTFVAPGAAGTYDFCVRASANGGASWIYCDAGGETCLGSGSDDGYSPLNAGSLTVP